VQSDAYSTNEMKVQQEAAAMAVKREMPEEIQDFVKLIPSLKYAARRSFWTTYDAEADVLYVNFKKPMDIAESELIEGSIVLDYDDSDEVIGLTILSASKR